MTYKTRKKSATTCIHSYAHKTGLQFEENLTIFLKLFIHYSCFSLSKWMQKSLNWNFKSVFLNANPIYIKRKAETHTIKMIHQTMEHIQQIACNKPLNFRFSLPAKRLIHKSSSSHEQVITECPDIHLHVFFILPLLCHKFNLFDIKFYFFIFMMDRWKFFFSSEVLLLSTTVLLRIKIANSCNYICSFGAKSFKWPISLLTGF